jgi:hypothetical protein
MPFDATAMREAANETPGGEAPPDGLYDAELTAGELATRKSDGVQWAAMTFRVMSGPHRDAQWTSMWTLERFKSDGERSGGFGITVQSLRTMGVDVDQVFSEADLKRALSGLEGSGFSVEVKRNGQWLNTNPRSRLETPSLQGSGYGQQPQSLGAQTRVDTIEHNGASDVTSDADVQAFDRSSAPKQGDVDPATGEAIPV